MSKGEGLIEVSKKVKIAKKRAYVTTFWRFSVFAGGLKEGVHRDHKSEISNMLSLMSIVMVFL